MWPTIDAMKEDEVAVDGEAAIATVDDSMIVEDPHGDHRLQDMEGMTETAVEIAMMIVADVIAMMSLVIATVRLPVAIVVVAAPGLIPHLGTVPEVRLVVAAATMTERETVDDMKIAGATKIVDGPPVQVVIVTETEMSGSLIAEEIETADTVLRQSIKCL